MKKLAFLAIILASSMSIQAATIYYKANPFYPWTKDGTDYINGSCVSWEQVWWVASHPFILYMSCKED